MFVTLPKILIALGILFNSQAAFSEETKETPFSLSLFSPVQFPPAEFNSVRGLRTSLLWGQHRNVYGVDLGLGFNHTEQDFMGLGIAGVGNINDGQTIIFGFQVAGLMNLNNQRADIYGIQAALFNENADNSKIFGMQFGVANMNELIEIYGLQVGFYNSATEIHGLQVGIINSTKNLYGVQIGLINFNSRGLFKVLPLLNAGF